MWLSSNRLSRCMDRGDAYDLLDVVRQELGFSEEEKRFPRTDTCLAICSHKVNSRARATNAARRFS